MGIDWENITGSHEDIPALEEMKPATDTIGRIDVKKAERIMRKPRKYLKWAVISGAAILVVFVGTKVVIDQWGGAIKIPSLITSMKKMDEGAWAKIVMVKPGYLLAIRNNGHYELRTKGRAGWRYNNPGKLVHGKFTREQGALGSDGKLALFPSYEMGRRAMEVLLFESKVYRNLTVKEAMEKFAPASEGYDPVKYAKALRKAADIPDHWTLGKLDKTQRRDVLNEIENQEDYIHGETHLFENKEDFELKGY